MSNRLQHRSASPPQVHSEMAIGQLPVTLGYEGSHSTRRARQLVFEIEILAEHRALQDGRNCVPCFLSLAVNPDFRKFLSSHACAQGTQHAVSIVDRPSSIGDRRVTMDDGRWTMDDGRWTMDDAIPRIPAPTPPTRRWARATDTRASAASLRASARSFPA
jgi:hypothetical protein